MFWRNATDFFVSADKVAGVCKACFLAYIVEGFVGVEQESICLTDLWKQIAQSVGDDLIICVPTKDIVFYTKASDKKKVKKLLQMAEDMFEHNRKETPYLLFCKDVFLFDRKKGELEITNKYRY